MATLKEVAAAAGVHYTVVSSILNGARGNSRFSDDTRRAVETAARKLGYTRNEAARNLRTRSAKAVGLVAGNIRNPFFSALATSLEHALAAVGYQLLLANHGTDSSADKGAMIRSLLGRGVDAVVVWSEGATELKPANFRRFGRPVIWMGLPYAGEWCVEVGIAAGLQAIATDLAARGHRNVGYFLPRRALESGLPRPRPELFAAAAAAAGLAPPVHFLYEATSWDVAAAAAAAAAVELPRHITAVVGYNDVAALAWLMARNDHPSEVEVVGFDGTDNIRCWRPGVRFVDLRIDQVAAHAASLVQVALSNPRARRRRVMCEPIYATPTT